MQTSRPRPKEYSDPSFFWKTLYTSLAVAVIVLGVPLYEQYSTSPSPATSSSFNTTAPTTSSSTARNPDAATLTPFNSTYLAQQCQLACLGGDCTQSSVTGVTSCISCPTGYSVSPTTLQCSTTGNCAAYPWCTTSQANQLKSAISIMQTTSPNSTTVYANNTYVMAQVGGIASTAASSAALFNQFYSARKLLLSQGNQILPTQYWDDQANGTPTLPIYLSTMTSAYAPLILSMKQFVCTSYTWQASGGTCVPPSI